MANPIPLPYAKDALEPHIDAATMEVHYEKHYKTYITKYNAAVEGTEFEGQDVEQVLKNLDAVPEEIRVAVRNNGGGFYNHTLFWEMLSPNGGGEPKGELAEAINSGFNSFADFKETFTNTAIKIFGSGWAWLCVDEAGLLVLKITPLQDNPIMEGLKPILGLDVWEHAYYLKFQNRRNEYIESWWNVVNWEMVSELYQKARA